MSKEKLNTTIQNESTIEPEHQYHNNKIVGHIIQCVRAGVSPDNCKKFKKK